MPDTLTIDVFNRIKESYGCSTEDLIECLPPYYARTDVGPEPALESPLITLLDLHLIEVYRGNTLVPPEVFKSLFDHGATFTLVDKLRELQFFVSRTAVDTEQTLGISLASRNHGAFGHPSRSDDYPEFLLLMPFHSAFNPISRDCVQKMGERLGLSVGRADDIFSTRSVMHDVWSAINQALVIVVDCTEKNPNVFYEIGVAHTLGKATVLLAQSKHDIPFDLQHLRVVIYDPKDLVSIKRFQNDLWCILRRLCEGRV